MSLSLGACSSWEPEGGSGPYCVWKSENRAHPRPLSKWMMNVLFPNFSKVS